MRGFILALVVVVLGAGALSIAILPNRQELGTMYLRDHKYDESRALFERQIAEGDLSTQTVSALLTIYLQYGDVDRAIDLIRQYGATLGDRPDVLERLAQLYAADLRLGLYRQTLERLVAVAPTAARLEALADASLRAGDRPGRAAALSRLVERGWASPERMLEFAELALSMTHLAEARTALLWVAAHAPQRLDWSYRSLIIQLGLRAGETESADSFTTRWLDGSEPESVRIEIAQIWLEAGDAARALAILGGRPAMEARSEAWRASYVLALRRAGRSDLAFGRMSRWLGQGLVTPALSIDFIELATAQGAYDLALDAFDRIGAERLPTAAVLMLVTGLHQAQRTADVDRVVAALGQDRMAALPILAMQIALARGETAAARHWVDVALSGAALAVDDRLTLAPIMIELGDDARAFGLLRPLADGPSPPSEVFVLLGELYARGPDPERGYWEVNALLARRYTPELRAVWAELGLAIGRDQEVEEWLARTKEIEFRNLDNLFFIAERRNSWNVAVAAARRMLELRPSDRSSEQLAVALLQAGQATEALAMYETIATPSPESEALYADILQALGLTQRLVALWQQQIARPGIPSARVEELVYNMLGAGADAAALPHLLGLAKTIGGSWWFALAETSARAGRGDIAADAIAAEIRSLAVDDQRLSALLAALDAAAPERAPAVLRILADRSPSLWADSYAIVLRERGQIKELNGWLGEKLMATTNPSDAMVFALRLAETAAPLDAARAIRPRADTNRGWAELYAELLRKGDRSKDALGFLVNLASQGRIAPEWRREIAFQALEAGNRDAADRLFRMVAASEPPDSPAAQQLFFLWGPRPDPGALDWIEARARKATGAERLAWLERLLAVRAGDRVIAIIGDVAKAANPTEIDMVVRAKAQGRQPEELRRAVTAAIDRTRDLETLVKLARTAESTRDRKLIVDSWRAVIAVAPEHPAANRELGLLAYDEGRLVDAERHLRAFVAGGSGDFEANYFLGEVLFRTGRKDQAGPYYQRAYEQLMAKPTRDFYLEMSRANILRRLDRLDDAVMVMDSLLEQRPKDRALRADFADLLIEKGDFKRARYVLQLR